MNADRWRQIENAFHGALLCQPSEREAHVLELCGDDQDLFREVITLILYYEKPDDFLERPQLSVGLNILATQDSELEEGETIGPYIVEKRIGRGGMGDVYLARDERLGRQIALKLLPKSFQDHQDWVGRFQHEARAASSISHPNVAHIYEVGEFRGRHYIAMEYIDGETLRTHLRNRGPLPAAEAVDIVTQVARALTAAHSAGVLHRDIKPDNVMLHRDGYVKVLDFGLAKSTGTFKSQTSGEGLSSVVTTEAGIIVGSPAYMSPEQARALPLDHRSDLWSLGVVFYELLTRNNPFASATPSDTIAAILKSEPPPLAPGTDEQAQLTVTKLLAKNPDDRYENASSLIADLESLSERLKSRKPSTDSPERRFQSRPIVEGSSIRSRSAAAKTLVSDISTYVVRPFLRQKLRLGLIGVIVVAALTVARYGRFSTGEINAAPITSLAILPFANESGDADSQYVSDGLSESLIARLSRLSHVKVIARDSSFKFRNKTTALQEVAKDLNVQAVVLGSVTRQGDNVHVTVELIDPNRTKQLWTGNYQYKSSEMPIILDDMTRKLAVNLNPNLSDNDLNMVTRSDKGSGDAYEWYLKGRFYWNQLTEESLDKSIECFNQALTIDPDSALAYSGLANSYITLGGNFRSTEEVFSKAEFNAQKALALDANLAEAHYAMAVTYYIYHWDLPGAEKELNRTLELNPNFAMAESLFSSLSRDRGNLSQATNYINRALELDPLSLIFTSRLSYIYYCQRESEKQVKLIQGFLDKDASASFFYNDLAVGYAQMGKANEALDASQRAMVLMGQDPDTLTTLGVVYAWLGKKDEAKWTASRLQDLSNKRYVPPFLIAEVYGALGDNDQAFTWLAKAVAQHDSYVLRIRVEPALDSLRSDARYQKLVQSLNLS